MKINNNTDNFYIKSLDSRYIMTTRERENNGQDNSKVLDNEINGNGFMELKDALKKVNDTINIFDKRYHFLIDDKTNRIVVQIINKETGEVIKEIPPEEVLKLAARIRELLGLFIDERR